jgi:hypothetical protein
VRHQATGFVDATRGVSPSIANMIEGQQPAGQPSDGPSQIVGERGRLQERMLFESEKRYASPEPVFRCDGWCGYSDIQHPNVVSIGSHSSKKRFNHMSARSSHYLPVRTCSALGKGRKAH